MGIKHENVAGLVRPERKKGDRNREKPYTAIMNDGRRVALDAGEAKSLMKRLDKDRSRMERSGERQPERERETRNPTHVVSNEARQRWLRDNFHKKGD